MSALLRASIQTLNSVFNYFSTLDNTVMWLRNREYDKQLFISSSYEDVWQKSCESIYGSPESWSDSLLSTEKGSVTQQTQQRVINVSTNIESNLVFYRIQTPQEIRYIKDWCIPIIENQQLIAYAGLSEQISAERWHEQLRRIQQLPEVLPKTAQNFLDILTKEFQLKTVKDSLTSLQITQFRDNILHATGFALTPREVECCYYLCLGKTAKEIAKITSLSFRTVEKYFEKAIEITKSSRRTDLVQKLSNYF